MNLPLHTKLIAALGLSLLAGSAHAVVDSYTFQVDSFFVFKNVAASGNFTELMASTPLFVDGFDNGYVPGDPLDAPIFSNGNPATYTLAGSVGPETGSKLSLSSSGMVDNGFGTLRTNINLNTNISADPTLGLKSESSNFFVVGVWDLSNPANNFDSMGSYGVRFNDSFGGVTGNDVISLAVQGTTEGGAVVSMLHFNNVTGTSDVLDRMMLDTTHQQIALGLGYVNGDGVGAGFFYIDGGVATGFTTMSATTQIFNGEDWTRAAFFAANTVAVPVPEPSDYAMMLAGLGMIGFVVRRRQA